MMDPVFLARLQFALTVGFHFLFPPISIGLAWLLVAAETFGWRRQDETWVRVGQFFGKLLGLTFAVGVATGIVMEFQFGTNWAQYSKFVGDIFGAPLAAEGVFAFFLESGFLGLYLFGRGRVSKGVHWFSALMVAVGAMISAFWILVANSWQQTPAGFVVQNGRAELTSFAAAVFNPSMWWRFWHVLAAALTCGAFFMAGIAAVLYLKNRGRDVARKALALGLVGALIGSLMTLFPTGHEHAKRVAHTQPEKFAAIEGLYETQSGAPLVMFAVPFEKPPQLKATVELPGMLSWMAFGSLDAPIKGIDQFQADEVPPLVPTFISFHTMVGLGMLFIALSLVGVFLLRRGTLWDTHWFLKILPWAIPLPLLACQIGWFTAEVGRQPWIVYHLLKTRDAASITVSAGEILFSIVLFSLIYLALGAVYVYLLVQKVKHGPEPAQSPKEA
jgi:cytochrome d ubiquinol oxidase subunit I